MIKKSSITLALVSLAACQSDSPETVALRDLKAVASECQRSMSTQLPVWFTKNEHPEQPYNMYVDARFESKLKQVEFDAKKTDSLATPFSGKLLVAVEQSFFEKEMGASLESIEKPNGKPPSIQHTRTFAIPLQYRDSGWRFADGTHILTWTSVSGAETSENIALQNLLHMYPPMKACVPGAAG